MFRENKKIIQLCFIISIFVLIVLNIIKYSDNIISFIDKFFLILTPFVIGFWIAYIFNPVVLFLEEKLKFKKSIAILSIYTIVLTVLILFFSFLVPQLLEGSFQMTSEVSKWINKFNFNSISQKDIPFYDVLNENLKSIMIKASEIINNFVTNLSFMLVSITSIFFNFVLGIIISIYMLIEKNTLKNLFINILKTFLGKEKTSKTTNFAKEVNLIFSKFLTGLIVEAIIVGALAFVLLSILGIKYSYILAFIIMFTNVIPYFGPFIGAIPAIIVSLTQSFDKSIWCAILILILQQFDGNFIGPKIMGNYIGLSPIWIILSITIGGGFFGLNGMILAIPFAAIIKILFQKLMIKKQEKNN